MNKNTTSQDYRDLIAWQKAMELVTEIYAETNSFPDDERFGLTSQIRRAAVSIPSNIAEGQGRRTRGEFRQFLGNARGSLAEVETQILIAHKLNFIPNTNLLKQTSELGRILNGLIRSLN